jgi:hypothetical protein
MTAMTFIQTVTVGSGGQAQIDFTSIPTTFTDLLVVVSPRLAAGGDTANVSMRFNDSTATYNARLLYGTGSGVSSASASTNQLNWQASSPGSGATSNTFGSAQIYITNYRSSAQKSVSTEAVTENNATGVRTDITAGLWTGTDPITKVSLIAEGSTFVEHSSASLYGILAGSSGGVVVS